MDEQMDEPEPEKTEEQKIASEKAKARLAKVVLARAADKIAAAEEEAKAKKREKKEKNKQKKLDKEQKKYLKEIKDKENDIQVKRKKLEQQIATAEEKAEKAEAVRDGFVEDIEKASSKNANITPLSEKETKALASSSEVTLYLRNQEKKLRASTTQLRKDLNTILDENITLQEIKSKGELSLVVQNETSKKNDSTMAKLNASLEKYSKANKKLQEDLQMRQIHLDAEVENRVNYQKSMASIVEMIQGKCDDVQLTEDILVLALECEAEAQSELANM
jgi:hypothetical protein